VNTQPHHYKNVRTFAALNMAMLKELRSKSGAPMVECKKALEETGSESLDEAMDWLRKHGAAKASSKLAGREAEEGLVGIVISPDAGSAAIVQVNSETDFAGRSQTFSDLVEHVAKATLQVPEGGVVDDSALREISVDGKSVQEAMEEAIVSIRENLRIASAIHCVSDQGQWVGYVHGRVNDIAGTSAAVVHVQGADDATLQEVGKKLAMHVVAARPKYLNPESIPADAVEKEKEILREQMADSGKPAEIMEKIIGGKMRKFYEGSCLTEQAHMVLEGNPKVQKALKDVGVEVTHFEFKAIGG
jgi:elongation factor Ts